MFDEAFAQEYKDAERDMRDVEEGRKTAKDIREEQRILRDYSAAMAKKRQTITSDTQDTNARNVLYMKHSAQEIFELVQRERTYQDLKYADGNPCPPSDELRIIRTLLAQADQRWYNTEDRLVSLQHGDRLLEGQKVNDSDLDIVRKIAATAFRCLQRWGYVEREGGYGKPSTLEEDLAKARAHFTNTLEGC